MTDEPTIQELHRSGRVPLSCVRGAKTRRLLREISDRGGMTLTEIQRFICSMNNLVYKAPGIKPLCGYWCTSLYGTSNRRGILERYCVKDGRRWRLR